MELTADLVIIQGMFASLEEVTGELRKIRYKGGNEPKISRVISELEQFLILKGYMKDKREINTFYKNEVTSIVMFLVLNSEFRESTALDLKEYIHLVNIMPILSKCLLANIVIKLNLSEYYGAVIQQLPLDLTEELLTEIVVCLKKTSPPRTLIYTYEFIKQIILKLTGVDPSSYKVRESVNNLNLITSQLLLQISGIDVKGIEEWNQTKFFQHIGFTILKLLRLLQICELENNAISKIIDELIRATCNTYKLVSTLTFCTWSEVKHAGEALQTVLRTEAYYVVEKFTKYEPAEELVKLLSTLAAKPKSLNEQILEATSEQIIAKIELCDTNQRRWFAALLRTHVFENQLSMDCIHKWSKLCTLDDVNILLKTSVNHDTEIVKKLVIHCASNLSVKDLSIALNRFFRQTELKSHLECSNIIQELTYLLNKINHHKERNLSLHELENTYIKDIQLLLLQNPEALVFNLYTECIKNSVYTFWLKHAFSAIIHIMNIKDLGLKSLEKSLKLNKITANNVNGYSHLIIMLIEANCLTENLLIGDLCIPYINQYLTNENHEDLKCMLLIIKDIPFKSLDVHHKVNWKILLIKILQIYRTGFTEFSFQNLEISNETVNNLEKFKDDFFEIDIEETTFNPIDLYYIKNNYDYLESIYPDFNLDDYAKAVSQLIKILPQCVPQEWLLVGNEIETKCSAQSMLQILTDCLIVMCHFGDSLSNEEQSKAMSALKYSMQNYGAVIKNVRRNNNNQNYEINVIKNVCRLLQNIPKSIKFLEGVNLITLFSENALKSLTNDRPFVCSLVNIENAELAQMIAKKMLS